VATTASFTMIGVAGRRLRVGQWHAGGHAATVANGKAAADARPLVILGGIGMNMEMLEPIASRLPGRRIVSFDMPGIGGSPDPIFPYTIPHMALTLAALLDRLHIDTVDLLGISWGGAVVQQFAFQHRARTGKLVLAATSAGGTMIPGNPSMISKILDPMEYSAEKALRRNLATFYNGGGVDTVSLNAATAPSPLGWSCQLAAFASWSSAAFLPLLGMPVLIMADEDDQLVPPTNAHFLHHAVPGSRLEMSEGGGHLFMLARPEPFCARLAGFLDRVR
jgi:pimeloyl-ACP methyl ester carboxylesterase